MKKRFNLTGFLYVCWSIAIVCNIAVYSSTKDINSLIFLIVLSVCLGTLIIIDIITSNSKMYIVMVKNTFYRFSENIIDKAKVISVKKIINKKLQSKMNGNKIKKCIFENMYAKVYFDLIEGKDIYSLLIIKRVKEKKKECFSFKTMIEDNRRNFSHVKEVVKPKPIILDGIIEIKYDAEVNNAFAIHKLENQYCLTSYRLRLANTFLKISQIDFDLIIWDTDPELYCESYNTLDEAIKEANQMIKWLDYGFSTPTNKMFYTLTEKKGSGFIEFQFSQNEKPNFKKYDFSNPSSLFVDVISGDSMDEFLENYGDIFRNGLHPDKSISLDLYGINFYSLKEVEIIIHEIEKKKPKDYKTILEWLRVVSEHYKGFYILGV